jgi:hypothetical protein
MTEDQELDTWREQWGRVGEPLPELRQIRRKIKRQQLSFVLDNLLAAIGFVASLIFMLFVRQDRSLLGTGWVDGICVLLFVAAGYGLWAKRGTWRAETQSTRASVELWQRRVSEKIRALRVAIYAAPGLIVFGALLIVANWATIGPALKAHPAKLALLMVNVLMLPAIFFWLAWYRRRKLAELNEVNKILDEMRSSCGEVGPDK